jgi:hypothetical protein
MNAVTFFRLFFEKITGRYCTTFFLTNATYGLSRAVTTAEFNLKISGYPDTAPVQLGYSDSLKMMLFHRLE